MGIHKKEKNVWLIENSPKGATKCTGMFPFKWTFCYQFFLFPLFATSHFRKINKIVAFIKTYMYVCK